MLPQKNKSRKNFKESGIWWKLWKMRSKMKKIVKKEEEGVDKIR